MKKFLAIAPVFAVLAACSSAPIAQPTPAQVQAVQANSQTFKCDNNTEVVALYTQRDSTGYANLKVTSPSLGLNQAAMVLKQDVAASGERFTATNADKTTSYEWHAKAGEGIFAVNNKGTEYNFVCRAI